MVSQIMYFERIGKITDIEPIAVSRQIRDLKQEETIMQDSAFIKIEKEIESLTFQEQLKLMESLVHQIKRKYIPENRELDWKKLYGLGKDLWEEDAQDYVNRLREDRL
jgi:hypothetical protein